MICEGFFSVSAGIVVKVTSTLAGLPEKSEVLSWPNASSLVFAPMRISSSSSCLDSVDSVLD